MEREGSTNAAEKRDNSFNDTDPEANLGCPDLRGSSSHSAPRPVTDTARGERPTPAKRTHFYGLCRAKLPEKGDRPPKIKETQEGFVTITVPGEFLFEIAELRSSSPRSARRNVSAISQGERPAPVSPPPPPPPPPDHLDQ